MIFIKNIALFFCQVYKKFFCTVCVIKAKKLIKALLKAALTDKIDDREVYMKGIDASYNYEGYNLFETKNLGGN